MKRPGPLRTLLLILALAAPLGAQADMNRLKQLGFQVPPDRPAAPVLTVRALGEEAPAALPLPGRVTLLTFWAEWNSPSRGQMPSLERLDRRFREEGLHLAAVNLNEEIPPVQDYLAREGLTLRVYYFPRNPALGFYKRGGLPASYLIDKKGRVAAALIGSTEWDHPAILRTIRELLEES